jgi:hypothetical protein
MAIHLPEEQAQCQSRKPYENECEDDRGEYLCGYHHKFDEFSQRYNFRIGQGHYILYHDDANTASGLDDVPSGEKLLNTATN